jgi:hypothetical protein
MFAHSLDEILKGNIDFLNDTISLICCGTSYLPNLAADFNQSDIPDGAFLTEVELTGNSVSGGVFSANPVTFSNVEAGTVIAGFALSKDTGFKNTSTLIAYFDVTDFVSDGTSIVVTFASGLVVSL